MPGDHIELDLHFLDVLAREFVEEADKKAASVRSWVGSC
jgi:hypothetical protein